MSRGESIRFESSLVESSRVSRVDLCRGTDCVGRILVGAWVLISVQRALSERKEVLWYPLKHEVGALCATDI